MTNASSTCTFLLIGLSFISLNPAWGYFDATANPKTLQSFQVEGLKNQACGTVYPDGVLEHGGMPLCGLGTGYFCVDTDGRLGKISIMNRLPSPMYFGTPFFFLETEGERLTLATPKRDADGNITQPGNVRSIDYFGHYPVVDMKMTLDRPISAQCRAFSPFIPGDAATSNTPVAFFEIVLKNESEKTQKMKLIFAPDGFPIGEIEDYREGNWAVFQTTHRPIEGMPEWVLHTYALGAENGATEKGTAFVEREIAPGASSTARFILAWNQPYLREGSGRVEKNYYAERFENSKAVVGYSLKKRESWLRRILAAQDVIYGSEYPDWLKETLVTAPYALVKNAVWLAKTRPDDWWGDEGLILINESFSSCAVMDTMPCRGVVD
ncbi:MAG: GH116 family glycosyl-hydrolase [Planctomycetaceae bacterium]|nr:GH116 family glycosyl-hydrolase [Planctomycetaceae bacterium]